MRWAGLVARMDDRKGVYMVLVRKPEGKIPLGRPRCRREDDIKMYLQAVGCGGMDWIKLTQEGTGGGGTCECGNEPSGSIKCGQFLAKMKTC